MVATRDAVLDTRITVHADERGKVTHGRRIRVGTQGPHVVLFVDGQPIPMRTKQAVQLYLALGKCADELFRARAIGAIGLEIGTVVVTIEREPVQMWPEFARQLAGVLMRKADDADDWQINNPVRTIQ